MKFHFIFEVRACFHIEQEVLHWNRFFSQRDKIGNNANIGIRGPYYMKKSSDKMWSSVGIEPGPLIAYDSKSNTLLSALTWHLLARLRL